MGLRPTKAHENRLYGKEGDTVTPWSGRGAGGSYFPGAPVNRKTGGQNRWSPIHGLVRDRFRPLAGLAPEDEHAIAAGGDDVSGAVLVQVDGLDFRADAGMVVHHLRYELGSARGLGVAHGAVYHHHRRPVGV